MNVIEASALGKRYGSTLALRECSLAIPAGHARNPFFAQALAFLAQRFETLPLQNGRSAVGPGNSVGHVPVPAS